MAKDELMWFRIKVIYPVTSGLNEDNDDSEDSELKRIRLQQLDTDGYEYDFAYINLAKDNIVDLIPCCFLAKDRKNKTYYTDIVLESGNIINAVGKPDDVYTKILEYLETLPKEETPT
jgi:hypothetical protein